MVLRFWCSRRAVSADGAWHRACSFQRARAARAGREPFSFRMGTILPSVFLSGYIFLIENMPPFFQGINRLIPATYYIEMLRGIISARSRHSRIMGPGAGADRDGLRQHAARHKKVVRSSRALVDRARSKTSLSPSTARSSPSREARPGFPACVHSRGSEKASVFPLAVCR